MCAADSVTVTVGAQTIALATGQLITVSALGAVVTGTVTTTALAGFSGASVSTAAPHRPGCRDGRGFGRLERSGRYRRGSRRRRRRCSGRRGGGGGGHRHRRRRCGRSRGGRRDGLGAGRQGDAGGSKRLAPSRSSTSDGLW
ncbi:MAG: hypothetical protein ABSH03_22685 [Candidatus Lustribacter sp.]